MPVIPRIDFALAGLLLLGLTRAWAQPAPAPSSTALLPAERAIHERVIVNASLDDVWSAWTTTQGITTFFAPAAHVEARVDGPFEVYINPFGEPGMKGADDMRFLAVQDRKMISFTWNAPPSLPEVRRQRTSVTVRFEPQGDKQTIVTLYHSGWGQGGEWDKAFVYFQKAWPGVLANLQKRFDSGPVDWTDWLKRLQPPAAK
jgi:uncharacterized protein YndB with AHSA1/START domain